MSQVMDKLKAERKLDIVQSSGLTSALALVGSMAALEMTRADASPLFPVCYGVSVVAFCGLGTVAALKRIDAAHEVVRFVKDAWEQGKRKEIGQSLIHPRNFTEVTIRIWRGVAAVATAGLKKVWDPIYQGYSTGELAGVDKTTLLRTSGDVALKVAAGMTELVALTFIHASSLHLNPHLPNVEFVTPLLQLATLSMSAHVTGRAHDAACIVHRGAGALGVVARGAVLCLNGALESLRHIGLLQRAQEDAERLHELSEMTEPVRAGVEALATPDGRNLLLAAAVAPAALLGRAQRLLGRAADELDEAFAAVFPDDEDEDGLRYEQ
jgi:hypothetical protein